MTPIMLPSKAFFRVCWMGWLALSLFSRPVTVGAETVQLTGFPPPKATHNTVLCAGVVRRWVGIWQTRKQMVPVRHCLIPNAIAHAMRQSTSLRYERWPVVVLLLLCSGTPLQVLDPPYLPRGQLKV
ncbi:hypothetical protein BZA05DRAFT_402163 [Tricharina praecox]|uniref:uncharacterized protein n=1 Tax=Tricharina praecox TaxID=43433 RepID=UPI002220FB85|nr:uncharacterized protein BZA05DRAFT_402163 [Tricharina praecox]KAI5849087.1 hypothetical protein BZA05DRAFT_402163 [Tricharina praecox]